MGNLKEDPTFMNHQPASVPGKGMPFFCSWSGGKDSCLALHRACRAGAAPRRLLTMLAEDGARSRSHGLARTVIEAQAARLGIPLLTRSAAWADYEPVFVRALQDLGREGLRAGVFGDIDFVPHLEWDTRICAATGMRLCLPLWQGGRTELLNEFLAAGFKAVIVAVKENALGRDYLGRTLDPELVADFLRRGIDPCGESGEYHTVVVDGPLFSAPLALEPGRITAQDGQARLDVSVANPQPLAETAVL